MRTFALITMVIIAACSATPAPPMSGNCKDRSVPNLFGGVDEIVSYKECRWEGKVHVCRLEPGADAWRCVVVADEPRAR